MSESFIGQWAVRTGGKWHLIESEVTDRLVMRCGRQMQLVTMGGGSLYIVASPLETAERCEQCVGRIVRD